MLMEAREFVELEEIVQVYPSGLKGGLMGFGFNDTIKEKETGPKIEYKWSHKVTSNDWEDLSVNMRVQSILTGVKGTITELVDEWFIISVKWDNEKISSTSHKYYDNVILI